MPKSKHKEIPNTNIPFLLDPVHSAAPDPFSLKFICDGALGRLVRHLRVLGIDCAFEKDMNAHYLLYLARRDDRIILTKNRNMIQYILQLKKQHEEKVLRNNWRKFRMEHQLNWNNLTEEQFTEKNEQFQQWLKQKEERREKERLERESANKDEEFEKEEVEVEEEDAQFYEYRYYLVKARNAIDIIDEVVQVLKIPYQEARIFSICTKCNSHIAAIENREEVKNLVYSTVFARFEMFYKCENCGQIYWGKDKDKDNKIYRTAKQFSQKHSYREVNA
jgi:uncharacterized protein with PIN domain